MKNACYKSPRLFGNTSITATTLCVFTCCRVSDFYEKLQNRIPLTSLVLTAWQIGLWFAKILVEQQLNERAKQPQTYWIQSFGQQAMQRLDTDLAQLANGVEPALESLDPALGELPLVYAFGGAKLYAADGVSVPFRPYTGIANGTIRFREVKLALLARLKHLSNGALASPPPDCINDLWLLS